VDSTVTILIIVVVVLVIVLAAVGAALLKRKRSEGLRERFGPEYEDQVSRSGDRKTAETQLHEREQRRNKLDIHDLHPEDRRRFQESWHSTQSEFVDNPTRSLRSADKLVIEIMRVRGYPVDDFDRRAEDISVDHPEVVRHYRRAREVQSASSEGAVDTESQREALTAYRSLVEALLGADKNAADKNAADRGGDRSGGERKGDNDKGSTVRGSSTTGN
jgi:hypothetical protein